MTLAPILISLSGKSGCESLIRLDATREDVTSFSGREKGCGSIRLSKKAPSFCDPPSRFSSNSPGVVSEPALRYRAVHDSFG